MSFCIQIDVILMFSIDQSLVQGSWVDSVIWNRIMPISDELLTLIHTHLIPVLISVRISSFGFVWWWFSVWGSWLGLGMDLWPFWDEKWRFLAVRPEVRSTIVSVRHTFVNRRSPKWKRPLVRRTWPFFCCFGSFCLIYWHVIASRWSRALVKLGKHLF